MRNMCERVSGLCNINGERKGKGRQGHVRGMRNMCRRLPVRSNSHGIVFFDQVRIIFYDLFGI
jgi:hypothetical protein